MRLLILILLLSSIAACKPKRQPEPVCVLVRNPLTGNPECRYY